MEELKMRKHTLWLAVVVGFSAVAHADGDFWHERPTQSPDVVSLPSLAPLVKKVDGAVLTITVEADLKNANHPPVFKGFGFEFRLPDGPPMQGMGSGFIIHESGYALTNNHVIENADRIQVKPGNDPNVYPAVVVGADPKTDVALIKIEGPKDKKWPFIPLGDSAALQVGDFVVAIGNPFGLSQTVSTGILSAQHRREIAPSGRTGLYDFLQTDASINPGNSGGPLLNLKGEVIGINAAVNTAGQGLGFAIPINLIKQLLPQLKQRGSISRSWIGVGIRKVSPEMARGFGLDRPRGALIQQVVEDGPAARAGLVPGDIITRFDGTLIEEASDLPLLAAHAGIGKKIPVELMRESKSKQVTVVLGELPPDEDGKGDPHEKSREPVEETGKLGIQVQDLDASTRSKLGLPAKQKGAVVVDVQPYSAAFEGGLQPGDVVTEVNRKPIGDARAFVAMVKSTAAGTMLRILVRRGDATVFIAVVKP
jgi:serine protease Do